MMAALHASSGKPIDDVLANLFVAASDVVP